MTLCIEVILWASMIFIRNSVEKYDFTGYRLVLCTHYSEWDAARGFRDKYFLDTYSREDPDTWTFNHSEHAHFILYQGVDIISYAHLQFLSNYKVVIRMMAFCDNVSNPNVESKFLALIGKWFKILGYSFMAV